MQMGLREANQHFSRAIRAVRDGHEVILTVRGKPIAVLMAIRNQPTEAVRLRHLVKSGILLNQVGATKMRPFRPARLKGATVAGALREERVAWR